MYKLKKTVIFSLFILFSIIIFPQIKKNQIPSFQSQKTTNHPLLFRTDKLIPMSTFDPNKIIYAQEALISYHLFGALVMFDQNGHIKSELCSNFYWNQNSLVFEFDKKSKTPSGVALNAEDAALSLKRLMFYKKTATHGDLTQLLCPNHQIQSPFESFCPGIRIENEKLILTVFSPKMKIFLLPLLTSPEARIIPSQSIDKKTFKITNWEETSGPYFISQNNLEGNIILQANKNYRFYDAHMPQRIQFVSGPFDLKDIFHNDYDIISSHVSLTEDEMKSIKDKDLYEVFHTLPIELSYIQFSKDSLKDFSIEQRMFIGRILGEKLNKMFGSPFYAQEETASFFQTYSEGALSPDQEHHLHHLRKNANHHHWKRKPRIGMSSRSYPYWKKELEHIKNEEGEPLFELVIVDKSRNPLPSDIIPDTSLHSTDTGFYEDFSLISYQLKYGGFQLSEQEADQWIHDYINIEDKSQRSKKLQDLHYHILVNAYIYPIFKRPYTTIYKKSFTQQFSKFNLSTRLWHLRM